MGPCSPFKKASISLTLNTATEALNGILCTSTQPDKMLYVALLVSLLLPVGGAPVKPTYILFNRAMETLHMTSTDKQVGFTLLTLFMF